MLYLEIFAVIILILINGSLAMSELAVISSRKSRLEQLGKKGRRGALVALRLIDDQSRFLSTVQIGISLVGVFSGAFSGVTLGRRLGAWFNTFPFISPRGDVLGVGIMVVGITYLSLIFGELLPKRIALAHPERIASLVAKPMRWLSVAMAPVVWILHISTESVLHILGISRSRNTIVTEDEIKSLIAAGTRSGVFFPMEKELIEGVLRLADRSVRIIMTPRSRLVWIDIDSDNASIQDLVRAHRYSRLLVCKASVDHPVGVVHTKDLLPECFRGNQIDLGKLLKPLLFIPESTTVLSLLSQFKKEKQHMGAVVDEHGSIEGLVTLTDVIEAIAGDLPEKGEETGSHIAHRDDGSWLVDGTVPTDEIHAVTGIDMGDDVMMLAGFVLNHLGRMPEAGSSFIHKNARFEVVDMDGKRIDKVLIRNLEILGQV